jgi:hypothetical protein
VRATCSAIGQLLHGRQRGPRDQQPQPHGKGDAAHADEQERERQVTQGAVDLFQRPDGLDRVPGGDRRRIHARVHAADRRVGEEGVPLARGDFEHTIVDRQLYAAAAGTHDRSVGPYDLRVHVPAAELALRQDEHVLPRHGPRQQQLGRHGDAVHGVAQALVHLAAQLAAHDHERQRRRQHDRDRDSGRGQQRESLAERGGGDAVAQPGARGGRRASQPEVHSSRRT